MNAKILAAVVGILVLIPAGYASYGWKFGDCNYQTGYLTTCSGKPNATGEPPALVTGHTVYAKFVIDALSIDLRLQADVNNTLGLPTDFAAIAGYFVVNDTKPDIDIEIDVIKDVAAQRECVVWFNGQNLDQTVGAHPSDEDEAAPYDDAQQDYDFDRDIDHCASEFARYGYIDPDTPYNTTYILGAYAVAVEKGDCDPAHGSNFRYRGHLDFLDPNGIYHEVQEYDYNCLLDLPKELVGADRGDVQPGTHTPVGVSTAVSGIVNQLFPWTYTDPQNENGCEVYATPADNTGVVANTTSPANSTVTPGSFDLGHKCNGSIQDLFKERLWITQIHAPQYDATIQEYYTFALQVDTCAGLNIYEAFGKQTDQNLNNSSVYPIGGGIGEAAVSAYHTALDPVGIGTPVELVDLCTDGSSFSFDDTFRGRTVHSAPPTTTEEIMRGNSFDDNTTVLKHRENCRDDNLDWPHNRQPSGSGTTGPDCYPEDHKTAFVDLYVYLSDPTGGQWALHTKGTAPTTPATTTTAPAGYP
ncbi:MAG: hypothetical protein KY455_04860 [Euryarchaeota archaeon]|nr:hypothetical protein [Euryarchaeota archaeon]